MVPSTQCRLIVYSFDAWMVVLMLAEILASITIMAITDCLSVVLKVRVLLRTGRNALLICYLDRGPNITTVVW